MTFCSQGVDELTTTGKTKVTQFMNGGEIKSFEFSLRILD